MVKRIYEEVSKRIDPIHEQLPSQLQESIGTELEGIFHEVRRTRNDAGHPTGRIIERDEAYALLKLLPSTQRARTP
jgi:argininosuccinate lyase